MNTSMNDTANGGRVPTTEEAERIIAGIEALARAAAAIEAGPCPDWCTMPNGHVYESNDGLSLDDGVRRDHEHATPESPVSVSQSEDRDADGTIQLGRPRVILDWRGLDDMAPDVAHELARQLRQAALLAQQVERGQR